jgi:hypothetical protein
MENKLSMLLQISQFFYNFYLFKISSWKIISLKYYNEK